MEWSIDERAVDILAGDVRLDGALAVPDGAPGIVLFAHGSGNSGLHPRNRHVARRLNENGLATLLVDLLTVDEEAVDRTTGRLSFDIGLRARRLIAAADWLSGHPDTRHLRLGLFGEGTGVAAALVTAAERPEEVDAVVSRGGRPDLAGPALDNVLAPTQLIVGGDDGADVELNRAAFRRLPCQKELIIVPRATHRFAEPGALDQVARLALEWFEEHLVSAGRP